MNITRQVVLSKSDSATRSRIHSGHLPSSGALLLRITSEDNGVARVRYNARGASRTFDLISGRAVLFPLDRYGDSAAIDVLWHSWASDNQKADVRPMLLPVAPSWKQLVTVHRAYDAAGTYRTPPGAQRIMPLVPTSLSWRVVTGSTTTATVPVTLVSGQWHDVLSYEFELASAAALVWESEFLHTNFSDKR